jgi:mannosyltransferase OCH1-like enzyme
MIPKIIHYCWFGGNKLSEDVKRYIDSWHRFCPDYLIIEWNEKNFDMSGIPYVKEAYDQKKWAFVSDYVRLYALKNYGGIYLDTDVEIIKSLDQFLQNKAFIGAESKYSVCTAVIGAEKNAKFIDELLHLYDNIHFVNGQKIDMTPNSQRIFKYLETKYKYKDSDTPIHWNNCTLYPKEYFSPINCYTFKQEITKNTYCIHRFAGTWKNKKELYLNKIKAFITRIIGEDCRNTLKKYVMKGKNK